MNGKIIRLDLRSLGMAERPPKIFGAIKGLSEGDILVITNDHDPKHLQYMLKIEFNGAFGWTYKKQGPDEWIVEIKKLSSKETIDHKQGKNREELKHMLKRLHEAKPDELDKVKKGAKRYFKDTDPKELAMAEQELIQEGVSRQEMKRLCDVHLEVMKEQLGIKSKSIRLPKSHPIAILKDEHVVIKRNLRRLKNILQRLKTAGSFDKIKRQINTLKELSHFFLETEKHHQREEDAIFPRLAAHGITEPPEIFKEDHVEFKAKKRNLNEIAMAVDKKDFKEFKEEVSPIIEFLTKNLEEHIYKEDNILYPMALETLDKKEWPEVRKKFDAIGYCCFAPADIRKKKEVKKKKRGK
jgi:DUF438 domain-containing protein/uncharacterized protein (DUF2249 family)